MNKLLTIVIPTYNMQAYLQHCLDSLIVPDKQLAQIEVLVINDGSKDNSSAIAHEYETKYPASFRVIDKENGNYGSCVNRGLAEAQGKYIKVLDADDWFDTAQFAVFIEKLSKVNADMVLTPFMVVNECDEKKSLSTQPKLVDGMVADFNSFPQNKIFRYSMHMITYRTSLLREINYHQTEGISYTDTEWTHIPQYSVKTFVWFDNPIYQYRVGREGQTMDTKVLSKNIWKYEVISHSLINNAKQHPNKSLYPLADEFNLQQIEFLATSLYRMFLVLVAPTREDMEHLIVFDTYLKSACPLVYTRTDTIPLKKWLPVPYVRIWRATGVRIPVDFFRETYRRLKYGKQTGK